MVHCRAQTIIKIALTIVVPFFGRVFLTTFKWSPRGNLKAYSKKMYKARWHFWTAVLVNYPL